MLLAALLAGVGPAGPADALAAGAVGHVVKEIEVNDPRSGKDRVLDVHLWYPADAQDAAARPKTTYTSALYGEPLPNGWAPLSWKIEAATAREGAAFDPSGGPYAPIVFSHGATNDPFDYADTLEAIARAGFVVAAPTHTSNTQDDVRRDYINMLSGTRVFECRDGQERSAVPQPLPSGFPGPDCAKTDVPASMSDRARDVSAVLDELPGWFGPDVDAGQAGVMGHSRGTITALAAAGGSVPWGTAGAMCATEQTSDGLCWEGVRREPRVKAIMGMAIGAKPINHGVDLAAITVPTLLIYGERDRNTMPDNTREAADAIPLTTDKQVVEVAHAVHRSFDSNYCAQMQAAVAAFDADHDGTVSAAEAADTSRPLDRWNLGLIAASFPGSVSGKAVHYCAPEFFTEPVNIKRLVAATPNAEYGCPDADTDATCGWIPHISGPAAQANVCDPGVTTPPCTGVSTDQVKLEITARAVEFFRSRLEGTTPPVLTVPADITADATGPGGATVAFTATATDDRDPSPSVVCTPASGSLFAMGTTQVECAATDNAANTSHATFTVTVLGAAEQISRLIDEVVGASRLSPAIKAQLTAALRAFSAHRAAACGTLKAFTAVVRWLAPAQAAGWTEDANRIRAVLAC